MPNYWKERENKTVLVILLSSRCNCLLMAAFFFSPPFFFFSCFLFIYLFRTFWVQVLNFPCSSTFEGELSLPPFNLLLENRTAKPCITSHNSNRQICSHVTEASFSSLATGHISSMSSIDTARIWSHSSCDIPLRQCTQVPHSMSM